MDIEIEINQQRDATRLDAFPLSAFAFLTSNTHEPLRISAMRLRTAGSPLTDELVTALEALNIKTDTDLIFSNGSPTDIWLKLPSNTIALKELKDVVSQLILKLSAPGLTALELLDKENQTRERRDAVELSSGMRGLDDLVGGFGRCHVLEISGDRGSGKSVSLSRTHFGLCF